MPVNNLRRARLDLIEFAFADPGCMNFTQTRTTAKDEPAGSY